MLRLHIFREGLHQPNHYFSNQEINPCWVRFRDKKQSSTTTFKAQIPGKVWSIYGAMRIEATKKQI